MPRKTRRKTRKTLREQFARPTPEREARNETVSAGIARRVKPMIDIYRDKGLLSASQYEMLHYFRDQANLAENSPVRSCCDNSPRGGGGNGPGAAIISAKLEIDRIERLLADHNPGNASAMLNVLIAVARDDHSLSTYCIAKYGGRERYDKNGKFVAMVPVNERASIKRERANLLAAAKVITR